MKNFSVKFNNFSNANRRSEVENAKKESNLVSFQSWVSREANSAVKDLQYSYLPIYKLFLMKQCKKFERTHSKQKKWRRKVRLWENKLDQCVRWCWLMSFFNLSSWQFVRKCTNTEWCMILNSVRIGQDHLILDEFEFFNFFLSWHQI